jgi:hypothetical protein
MTATRDAHTPGPWRSRSTAPQEVGVPEGWPIRIESAAAGHDGELVAQSYGDANARLIAAAPDLLDTLHEVKGLLEGITAFDCSTSATYQNIRAVLAKAEAGQ